MRVDAMASPRPKSGAWRAVVRTGAGLTVGTLVAVWLCASESPAWEAPAILALAALAGSAWAASRVRARRRWRAALDRYVEQEEVRRTFSRRNPDARAHSQAR